VIKDCENLGDFSIALQKLYQRPLGESERSPVYAFHGFEDAHRCLRPADQLCISSVLSSALDYLESIPWTTEQTEQLLESLARLSIATCDAQKLINRTEPPPEGLRTALLDRILSGATAPGDPATLKGSRALMQRVMERNLSRPLSRFTADAFALGLQRCLSRLQQVLSHMIIETRIDLYEQAMQNRAYDHNADLTKLVDNLAWIFQLPQSQTNPDVRRDVAELMTRIHTQCNIPYRSGFHDMYRATFYQWHIFHQYIAEPLYLPVLKAVAEGTLVIDPALRTKLLAMWVPRKYASLTSGCHSEEMQAAFSAVLSTVAV
jgi:hypothetical protein